MTSLINQTIHDDLQREGVVRPKYHFYKRKAFVEYGVLFHKVIGTNPSFKTGLNETETLDIFSDNEREKADRLVEKMNTESRVYWTKFRERKDALND